MLKFPAIRKSRLMAAVAMGAGLVLSACQSLEQIAPPVAAVAARPSGNLELGRDLYLTKCTKCHAPEPIVKYSASEWETIAADMAVETNLNAHQTAAVRDYVMAVLASAEKSRPLDERRGM